MRTIQDSDVISATVKTMSTGNDLTWHFCCWNCYFKPWNIIIRIRKRRKFSSIYRFKHLHIWHWTYIYKANIILLQNSTQENFKIPEKDGEHLVKKDVSGCCWMCCDALTFIFYEKGAVSEQIIQHPLRSHMSQQLQLTTSLISCFLTRKHHPTWEPKPKALRPPHRSFQSYPALLESTCLWETPLLNNTALSMKAKAVWMEGIMVP